MVCVFIHDCIHVKVYSYLLVLYGLVCHMISRLHGLSCLVLVSLGVSLKNLPLFKFFSFFFFKEKTQAIRCLLLVVSRFGFKKLTSGSVMEL